MKCSTKRYPYVAPALALLALVGCGDDSAGSGSSGTTTPTSAPTASTMAEMSMAPETSMSATSAPDDSMGVGDVSVSDLSAKAPVPGASTAAVYATITNDGAEDLSIIGASSSASDNVQLHDTTKTDDGMQMAAVDSFDVPAGGTFSFESGGPHIMLLDVDATTFPQDEIDVTLNLSNGEKLTFNAPVSSPTDGESAGSMEGHDHEKTGSTMAESDHEMTGSTMAEDGDGHDSMPKTLHKLDEQLKAGEINIDEQLPIVEGYIDHMTQMDPQPGTPEAELLTMLTDLKAALEADDAKTAATAAALAHETAHQLFDH